MGEHIWHPQRERPNGLTMPVGIDPRGVAGPTRHQARGPRWRQTSAGLYVPATVDGTTTEQRILEQGSRIRTYGAVTAWAALRWRGASFFDGMDFSTGELLPVPLVTGGNALRPDPRVTVSAAQLAPTEREHVAGLWVATAVRALFDEVRRHRLPRQAVVDVEMAIAARLLTRGEFADYVERRNAWTAVQVARDALSMAGLGCRSPQEVLMSLVWMLDAGLPRPVCNRPVFDRYGRLVAIPDLLYVDAGCAGEYQGADHKDGARHRDDVARLQRMRAVGLEVFEVVGGDLSDRDLVVKRMLEARNRSLFLAPRHRLWTLAQPAWWPAWAAARGLL